ncbi:MAG: PAS domain S-box protein [Methylovulum sp.]|nr:MAG: PAS domain S-box protein [Methylovulum sp.]
MVTRFKTQSIVFYFGRKSPALRYGLAVLAVAIVTLATCFISVIGERAVFLLFFFAIIQATFWLGRNPGMLAMVLSLVSANVFILFPARYLAPLDLVVLNVGFCILSAAIIATANLHWSLTAALWESRQDLDHAQAVGQIGSWRLNVQRNELCWSDENHRIFGIPKGTSMTYETFLAIVHPKDREYVDRMWQRGLNGEPYDIEHRLIVAGKVKWVRERAILEFNRKGILLGGFGTTQDITDHKRNELAMVESRERYTGIVASAMDAIITIDADQRILLFNTAAEKMFGYTADQALGVSIERFIPARFRPNHGVHIRAFERTGTTADLVAITGLRANGEEFPIEASISQTGLDGEKLFTAILRDITERVREDSALKERIRLQDQLTKVAATVPGVICSFRLRPDGSSCIPFASPVFASVYGLSLDDVVEDCSQVFARIHPEDVGHVNETIVESARTLQPWRDSFRYSHPEKGEIWIEGHSMPLRETDGSILWHGYVQDVSERKLAEEELRNTQARLALVVEEVKAGYWDWDLFTRTLYLSPEWKRQIGFDENELHNRWEEWECRLHPDDRAFVLTATENYIAGHQPVFELEFRLRHKDGSYRWIHSRGGLLRDHNNRPYRMLGINLDITDYVKTKELSERRDKIEQSFRLYVASQTAAAIAHELNQPLAAISSYADVALHMLQTGNQNPQKLAHVIENCALQAQRAGQVIRQLLTLLHKGETVSEPVDINLSVYEALDLIRADRHLGAFKIELELDTGLPQVAGNRLQIQKVLINLLRNGLEAMHESGIKRGTLTVTTRSFADDAGMAQVTVSDSGKGVASAGILKTMFQPFYTTKPAGLGMGLAISHALIEAHGGKMWAEQNAGSGLNIHFTLPFVI